MIPILSVENMRKSDAATIAGGIPGRELMLRAGRGVVEAMEEEACSMPAAVVCGSGNNAGDGYVIAKLLREKGRGCTIVRVSEKTTEDGAYWFHKGLETGVPVCPFDAAAGLSGYGTVVDCLLGTGFSGTPRGAVKDAIGAVNAAGRDGAYIVSVDINSGLNGDSGMAETCVRSDLTVSVGGFKSGHFLNMAKDVIGKKVNCDIGITPAERPYSLIGEADLKEMFRPRKNFSHKGTYGYMALIGGSKRYSGAIRLAGMANAAMRAGAGVVKLAVPDVIYHEAAGAVLESTIFPLSDDGKEIVFREAEIAELVSGIRAAVFGMGIGTGEGAAAVLDWLIRYFSGPLAVDADGLNLMSHMDRQRIRSAAGRLILTPHLKEFSRPTALSTEDILTNPIAAAEDYARDTGAILLLKGPCSIITDGKETCLSDTGCAGMATAGSGDVLSGILGALISREPEALKAAAAAAWVNGKAGELAQSRFGSVAMTAGDTAGCVAEVVRRLETGTAAGEACIQEAHGL